MFETNTNKIVASWVMTPSSLISEHCFGETFCLHLQGKVSKVEKMEHLPPSNFYSLNPTILQTWITSILKTKAVCSSEMLVPTYRTTQL
jgi:hypothetical protein